MSNSVPTKQSESMQNNLRIKVLLEKLKSKLNNFSVLDDSGQFLGQIRDVKVDRDRRLNLVIYQPDNDRFFLLRSSHIQRVDTPQKFLVVDISRAQAETISEYRSPELTNPSPSSRTSLDTSHQAPTETSIQAQDNTEIQSAEARANSRDMEYETAPESAETPDILEDEMIRLLEERLIVNVSKHKVGEVIVRKEIETQMVQVPLRREKLIIEQVSPERKQLAEIDLGSEEITGIEEVETPSPQHQIAVKGTFNSVKTASLLLDAIAKQRNNACSKVRVELVVEDAEHQKTYQDWFNRCSGS